MTHFIELGKKSPVPMLNGGLHFTNVFCHTEAWIVRLSSSANDIYTTIRVGQELHFCL